MNLRSAGVVWLVLKSIVGDPGFAPQQEPPDGNYAISCSRQPLDNNDQCREGILIPLNRNLELNTALRYLQLSNAGLVSDNAGYDAFHFVVGVRWEY